MLDHVSLGVRDVARSKAFYDAALAPLGLKPLMPTEIAGRLVGVGYGVDFPVFWIQSPINGQPATAGNGAHVAFRGESRAAVDGFYVAAIAAGGVDDGKPGLRSEYHPDYYGAFVRDPDGHKIEAVTHGA